MVCPGRAAGDTVREPNLRANSCSCHRMSRNRVVLRVRHPSPVDECTIVSNRSKQRLGKSGHFLVLWNKRINEGDSDHPRGSGKGVRTVPTSFPPASINRRYNSAVRKRDRIPERWHRRCVLGRLFRFGVGRGRKGDRGQAGCGSAQFGHGFAQLGCGFAQTGCGIAQTGFGSFLVCPTRFQVCQRPCSPNSGKGR
jgi:hypothetical protein